MPANVNTNPNATYVFEIQDEIVNIQGGVDLSTFSVVFGYQGMDDPLTVIDLSEFVDVQPTVDPDQSVIVTTSPEGT